MATGDHQGISGIPDRTREEFCWKCGRVPATQIGQYWDRWINGLSQCKAAFHGPVFLYNDVVDTYLYV